MTGGGPALSAEAQTAGLVSHLLSSLRSSACQARAWAGEGKDVPSGMEGVGGRPAVGS